MKKFAICFIIMLMLGGIFGLTMQNIVPDAPVSGVAYADPVPCGADGYAPPPQPAGLVGVGP
jgi:hypothetical protein